jgi:hypothetical protein
MAGKITDLAALTGAAAATTDLIETVDVSDTSMAATGTNKKMVLSELVAFVVANGGGSPKGVVAAATNWDTVTTPGVYTTVLPNNPTTQGAPPTADQQGVLVVSAGGDPPGGQPLATSQAFYGAVSAWSRILDGTWTMWQQGTLPLMGGEGFGPGRVLTVVDDSSSPSGFSPAWTSMKITDLPAASSFFMATADLMEIVDVSDTSADFAGTPKQLQMAELITFLGQNGLSAAALGNVHADWDWDTMTDPGTFTTTWMDDPAAQHAPPESIGAAGLLVVDARYSDVAQTWNWSGGTYIRYLDGEDTFVWSPWRHAGNLVGLNGATGLWIGTQAQYDAISSKVSTVVYMVTA